MKHKPEIEEQWQAFLDPLTSEKTIQRRAEMMLAVDEGLGRIIVTLDENDLLPNTVIIFTSDNGYFFGEHGLSIERRLPYEESVRAPLIVAGPEIHAKAQQQALVSSIDIAPTIFDLAGLPIPQTMQGESFAPVLIGDRRDARRSAYVEYFSHEVPMPWTVDLDYRCLMKDSYKLIVWLHHDGKDELYNLADDPFEKDNLIGDQNLRHRIGEMQKELRAQTALALGF